MVRFTIGKHTERAFSEKKIEINAHEQRNDMNACYPIHISRHFNMQTVKNIEKEKNGVERKYPDS